MNKNFFKILTPVVFVITAVGILIYYISPAALDRVVEAEVWQPRIIIPQYMDLAFFGDDFMAERMLREESINARVPMNDGEIIITIFNANFDGLMDTQFIAFRNLLEIDSPVYLSYIDYDYDTMSYKRVWTERTAAYSPGTVNLFIMDLLGDRSNSILLSGLNNQGEHTLTIFNMNSTPLSGEALFSKIAEIKIDGTIVVRELERSQAYNMGLAQEQSFNISAFGRDPYSENILDQIETVFSFNNQTKFYEEISSTRIPGAQVEQRQVRELLGNLRAFENFISGLWHFITADGSINRNQYVYFDTATREIIFSDEETQQVFRWQNSSVTRYGLYISTQNISISTLRRAVDIELESLESIRIRVFEDLHLRPQLPASTIWDGSYIKASPPENQVQNIGIMDNAFITASYDSTFGRMQFFPDGNVNLTTNGTLRQGTYTFFRLNEENAGGLFLELRLPESRETYSVTGEHPGNLSLSRVRIGANGIERSNEIPVLLTLASD